MSFRLTRPAVLVEDGGWAERPAGFVPPPQENYDASLPVKFHQLELEDQSEHSHRSARVREEIGDSVAAQIEAKFPNLGRVELLIKMTLK